MKKREQELLDAAQEILSDFNRYGEVLQVGDNGEYGTESAIGRLSVAVHQYDDIESDACDDCPYYDKITCVCNSPIGCLNEGVIE